MRNSTKNPMTSKSPRNIGERATELYDGAQSRPNKASNSRARVSSASKLTPKALAIHEAGHAVAAIEGEEACGFHGDPIELSHVTIAEKGNAAGFCKVHVPYMTRDTTKWRLIVALSGPEAQTQIARRKFGIECWDDVKSAEEILGEFEEWHFEKGMNKYFNFDLEVELARHREFAKLFVRRHREVIKALAEVLLIKKTLRASEVRKTVKPLLKREMSKRDLRDWQKAECMGTGAL